MQVQEEFVLNTSHDYKRTNRSLYIGNITRSLLSLPRTEMALRALPCGKILYVLMFIQTTILLSTLSNAFSLTIQIYLYQLTGVLLISPFPFEFILVLIFVIVVEWKISTHSQTHTHRGGPSTFGALGELHSWRPPPINKKKFPHENGIATFKRYFAL